MPRLSKNDKIRNDTLAILNRIKKDLHPLTFNAYNQNIRFKRIDVVKRIQLELTTQYIQNIEITYEYREKLEEGQILPNPWRTRVVSITITDIKKNLPRKSNQAYDAFKYKVQNESPIETRNWSYKLLQPIPIQPVGINNIPMKDAFSFGLSNESTQVWDKKQGTCVIDYLSHTYGNTKKLIKLMKPDNLKKEFQEIADDFQKMHEDKHDVIEKGITINFIRAFCEKYGLSYYALDTKNQVIQKFVYPNSDFKAFIFRLINGHLYPIDDEKIRRKVVKSSLQTKRIMDTDMTSNKDINIEKKVYDIITPCSSQESGNQFIMKNIMKLQKIPFPFTSSNISYNDGNINFVVIDDKKILADSLIREDGELTALGLVKQYMEDNEQVYQGETPITLLTQLWNEIYETDIGNNKFISKYNDVVYNFLNCEGIKYRTHYGSNTNMDTNEIQKEIENGNIKGWDIKKCYSSLLLNPLDNFLVYDVNDDIEIYRHVDGDLPFGLYVVETDDLTILHQSNIYSNKILDYARNEGIDFTITHQIIKRKKYTNECFENKQYFHTFIDKIKEKNMPKGLMKLVINSITGFMGRTEHKKYNIGLNTNILEVFEEIQKVNEKNQEIYFEKVDGIFVYGKSIKTDMISNSLPVYIQILDWSNILLHKMIKQMKGQLIYRHTDCAICITQNECDEVEETDDICSTWGTYKNESLTTLKYKHYDSYMKTDRDVTFPKIQIWKKYNYNSSNQFQDIIKLAKSKGGLLIKGRAGTGKDYIVEKGLPELDPICKMALTNKASLIMGGTTIHKSLGINQDDKACSTLMNAYKNKDIVVINEISMITANLWYKLYLLKKKQPHLTFILLGDYRQCKPIEEERIDINDYNYFNHSIVKFLTNYNMVELTERQRYDKEMWDFLEDFYEKRIINKPLQTLTTPYDYNAKKICYYNRTRKQINRICMNAMKPITSKLLKFDDDENNPSTFSQQSIYLYEGLPVMSIKNVKDYEMVNGDEFIVKSFTEETFTLDNDLEIPIEKFHIYFVANYIATTHKLQGQTITEDLYVYNYEQLVEDRNLGYTAFSRVKKHEQLKRIK